jgi:preprotein translocase subunit SecB
MSEQPQPQFSIEKIYTKDISLELPHAPQIFLERENPKVEVQMATKGEPIRDDFHHVLLTVTVTAKLNERVLFLVEVGQGGIFQIKNVPAEELEPILNITCPNILFPYAREAVSSTISRCGLPPVWLAPVNFEVIYQQRAQLLAEQQRQASGQVSH